MPILDGINGFIDQLTGAARKEQERKEQERIAGLQKQAQQSRSVVREQPPLQVPTITPDRAAIARDRQQSPGPAERIVGEQSKERVREAVRIWDRQPDPEIRPVHLATERKAEHTLSTPAPSPGGLGSVSATTAREQWWARRQEPIRAEQEAKMRTVLQSTPEQLRDMVRGCDLEHDR